MGWMVRRPRLFAPGILYHVIVRGNYRQKTFLNRRDYDAYLERLALPEAIWHDGLCLLLDVKP